MTMATQQVETSLMGRHESQRILFSQESHENTKLKAIIYAEDLTQTNQGTGLASSVSLGLYAPYLAKFEDHVLLVSSFPLTQIISFVLHVSLSSEGRHC